MKTAVLMAFRAADRSHVQSDQIDALKNGLGIPVLELRGCVQIDIGRSYLATVALQHGAEVVVFIDDDMEFVPGDVLRLADVARELEVAPDVIALAAVLNQPWADVVLSGAVTPEQLASNLAALDVVVDDWLQARLGRLAEPADRYWSERSRLPWA